MRITWYGHAAFLIETEGLRIVMDPFRSPDSGGYEPIDEPADIVVVSHENDRYHSHLGQILPPFEVVRGLELPADGRTVFGIRFEAIRVFETPERLPGDEVTIVHFESEGMRMVHFGDLGHALTEAELDSLRRSEIVLVPAGGPPTIDFPLLGPLLDELEPRLVVPMHFKTPKINLKIQPVERFLEAMPGVPVDRPGCCSIDVSPKTLPAERRIVLLEHAR
jgi:L-ascorbate metabolism protein UlaG (beta-lactamase superfamily)